MNSPISIVIPIYNEVENIEKVFMELMDTLYLNFSQYEIIFVDDKSTDDTLSVLERLRIEHGELKIVQIRKKLGQSAAILEGIKNASFEIVAIMDGDGQYFPQDIVRLRAHLTDDIQLVSGKRDNRKDRYFYRKISKIGNKAISAFLGTPISDLGCGLKLGYKKHLVKMPYFSHVHRYFQVVFFNSKLKYKEVEITHRYRTAGESKYSILKVFNILPRLIWLKMTKIKLQQ